MSRELRQLIREVLEHEAFTWFLQEMGAQHRHDISGQQAAMDKLKDVVFGPPGEYTLRDIARQIGGMNIPNLEQAMDALTRKGLVKKVMHPSRGVLYIVD